MSLSEQTGQQMELSTILSRGCRALSYEEVLGFIYKQKLHADLGTESGWLLITLIFLHYFGFFFLFIHLFQTSKTQESPTWE